MLSQLLAWWHGAVPSLDLVGRAKRASKGGPSPRVRPEASAGPLRCRRPRPEAVRTGARVACLGLSFDGAHSMDSLPAWGPTIQRLHSTRVSCFLGPTPPTGKPAHTSTASPASAARLARSVAGLQVSLGGVGPSLEQLPCDRSRWFVGAHAQSVPCPRPQRALSPMKARAHQSSRRPGWGAKRAAQ